MQSIVTNFQNWKKLVFTPIYQRRHYGQFWRYGKLNIFRSQQTLPSWELHKSDYWEEEYHYD